MLVLVMNDIYVQRTLKHGLMVPLVLIHVCRENKTIESVSFEKKQIYHWYGSYE